MRDPDMAGVSVDVFPRLKLAILSDCKEWLMGGLTYAADQNPFIRRWQAVGYADPAAHARTS